MTNYEDSLNLILRMRNRIPSADYGITPGTAAKLADDIQEMATSLKPAMRQANLTGYMDVVERCLQELRKQRSDKERAVSDLDYAIYGVYMRVYHLAHPKSE